jgi:mono/diheme cytochrome c family protein
MSGVPGGMMGGYGMGGYGYGMRGYGGGMMGGSMLRHRQVMTDGIPAAYARLRNPLPSSTAVIAAGNALYRANCAACHGDLGEGDGPAAAGMSPPPANLRWSMARPVAGDGYLMWTISEGGGQLGTAMPAFKDALTETDRWKLIRFLRTL